MFHVDVNSAFLSWEAARRVAAGEADLRLIPSAIGGDRDKRTGIILAKSIPAKKYGVTTGEPVGMALRKCPQYTPKDGTILPITVCTEEDLQTARQTAAARHVLFGAAYCLECLIVILIYIRKRAK